MTSPLLISALIAASTAAEPIDSFPMPTIPPALTAPEARAEMLVGHFFDGAILPDAPSEALELALANFTTVAGLATEKARRAAATTLYSRATTDKQLEAVKAVTEQYLFSGDSPYLDLDLYSTFLAAEPPSMRRDALMELAGVNKTGTKANDIPLTTDKGDATTLIEIAATAPQTLLIFFDPDCETCHEVMSQLAADNRMAAAIAEGKVNVVAVAPGAGEAARADFMPDSWTVATDSDDAISDGDLYFIPAFPEGYIIGRDGIVARRGLRTAADITGGLGL